MIKLHKFINIFLYMICLIWGEYIIMTKCRERYFTIFLVSFSYSLVLYYQKQRVRKLIDTFE